MPEITLNELNRRSNGRLSSAPDFPPPIGYFVPAKMPLHVVHPRPDIETNTYARHRNYHSQMVYEVPIGFQGGAWPFKYEITDAPAGATIGGVYGSANYGVLRWTPGVATGTKSFSVKVTDASGVWAVTSWTAVLNDGAFVFIQDGYSGTKVGTIDQPLEDIADWYKNSDTDDTYKDKIIVFREGEYLATGNAAANPADLRMSTYYKTGMFIGFPGETAVIDCQYAKIHDVSGRTDIYVAGLTFKNARNDQSNAQFFILGGYNHRATFWNVEFREMSYGQIGNDNTSPIFSSSPGAGLKDYFMLKQCRMDQINTHSAGNNGSYVDLYRTNYVLIEENVAKNSTTSYGFWEKAATSFITIRGNIAVENVSGSQFTIGNGGETLLEPHDKEMCWNICRVPSTSTTLLFAYSGNTVWNGQGYNFWCYRNTAVGQAAGVFQYSATPVHTDGNIFAVTNTASLQLDSTEAVADDIVVPYNSTIVDSFGHLTGATGFGTNGGGVY